MRTDRVRRTGTNIRRGQRFRRLCQAAETDPVLAEQFHETEETSDGPSYSVQLPQDGKIASRRMMVEAFAQTGKEGIDPILGISTVPPDHALRPSGKVTPA